MTMSNSFLEIPDLFLPLYPGSVSSFRQVFENPIGKCQQPNCSKEEEEIGNKRAAEVCLYNLCHCITLQYA